MMKKFNVMALFAALTLVAAQANAAPERVGDFNLIDQNGTAHQLSKYAYQKAVVFVTQTNSCSASQTLFSEYKILNTKWDDNGISFVMINPSLEDNTESINRWNASYNVEMPILIDDTQLVAEELSITKGGEIVIVDPTARTILYRGPMDTPGGRGTPGTTFMKEVLTKIAAGETRGLDTTVVEFEAADGCGISFPSKMAAMEEVPDYETEVAPILIERCVTCHIDGGIAPFAMNSHQMIQGWSPMIKEVLMTKRMPPMQVDPTIRHFDNARNIPPAEVQTLVHWIDAGSPRE